MTDKEIMGKLNKSVFGYKAELVFTRFRQAVFSAVEKEDFYLLVVNKRGESMQSFTLNKILQMPFSEILSKNLEFFTKEYKIVLMVKIPKPTYLDKVEENYLRNIIAPLARSGCRNFTVKKKCLWKGIYYIMIRMDNAVSGGKDSISMPMFKESSKMYKNLKLNKEYSIDYLVE